MKIRQGVHQTRKVFRVVSSVLSLQLFPGIVGNGLMWHSTQQRLNTWIQVKKHVRSYA